MTSGSDAEQQLADFLAERNQALTTLDMAWARKHLPFATSDEAILIALHKARLECKAIADVLRRASAQWLSRRGYKTMTGDIPDPERLPE